MKKDTLKFIILTSSIVILTILFWGPITTLFTNPEQVRDLASNHGFLAPIIFILFATLQVIIAPIPGQLSGIAGGYLFGVILGTIYSMIGVTIGSYIVFFAARKLGKPFVEKLMNKNTIKKMDKVIKKGGIPTLFLIFLFPIFPDDMLCYVAGLTKIKTKNFMAVTTLGRIPSFIVLSLIGARISYQNPLVYLIIGIYVLAVVITYLNKDKIEEWVKKR